MSRFVVDTSVVLHLLAGGAEPAPGLELLAPTLIRSEVLESLYLAVRRGELEEPLALARLATFSTMKIRYLGDKVLRRQAWKVASHFGWESTSQAEYVALTQLQADALVTLDSGLAKKASELVRIAELDEIV